MVVEFTIAIISVVTALLTAFAAGIKMISTKIESIRKEFEPNGGSSFRDQINRLDHRIDEIWKALYEKEK